MLSLKDLDLNDVHLFVKVATLGSFTKAGAYFGVPTSSVSRKVGRLERVLEARLLERSTRSLRLTPMGKLFYQYAHQGLADLEFGTLALGDVVKEPRGRLRISAPVVIGQQLLSDLLGDFMVLYPNIQVILSLSNRLVDLVHEDVDMAIRAGKLSESSLVARKLGNIPVGLFASRDYMETHGPIETPQDLGDHPILDVNPGWENTTWHLTNKASSEKQNVQLNPRLATPDIMAVLKATLQGLGLGKIPLYPVVLGKCNLIQVLPDWLHPCPEVHVVYPHYRSASPALRAFLEYLITRLAKSRALGNSAGTEGV